MIPIPPISFKKPNPGEINRRDSEGFQIWKSSIPAKVALAAHTDLAIITHCLGLSGSSIVGVNHFASLQTLHRNSKTILRSDLVEGIRRECEKEEKVLAG